MAKNQNTFAKRQREMEKKAKAQAKKARREERKQAGDSADMPVVSHDSIYPEGVDER